MKRLLAIFLLCASCAFGQGGQLSSATSPIIDQSGRPIPGAGISVCVGMATTAASVSGDIATLTMASNPIAAGFYINGTILVSGFQTTDAYLNGIQTIYNITSTQIQFPVDHANATAATQGNVVQQGGNSQTACLPLATIYTDSSDTTTSPNPFNSDGYGNWNIWAAPGLYVVQVYGNSITTTLKQLLVGSSGGGGGGGNPAGNAGDLQDKVNSTTFGASHINDGGTYAGQLTVSENIGFEGPRPWIDVTAYGAKGDNVTDDTVAITNAINAACATTIGSLTIRPDVVFPPGFYLVDQQQGASTNPDLPTCSELRMLGVGGSPGDQFGGAPHAIIAVINGASPAPAAPVFKVTSNNETFQNLQVSGYNEAITTFGGSNLHLNNVSLGVQTTSQTDNAPLVLNGIIWVFMDGGTLQCSCNEGVLWQGTSNNSGLFFFSNMVTSLTGPFLHYSQRSNTGTGEGLGDLSVVNVTRENGTSDFITITNDTGNPGGTAMPLNGPISLSLIQDSDSTAVSLINFNASGATLSGVFVNLSGGFEVNAIKMQAGTLSDYHIIGCDVGNACANSVVDANGNAVGSGTVFGDTGGAYTVSTSTTPNTFLNLNLGDSYQPPANRWFNTGTKQAALGADATLGLLYGDGFNGFSEQVSQNSLETLGISFATNLPPTSVLGTATTGGTLAPNTYYYVLRSYQTGQNCGPQYQSVPSIQSTGVVVSGSNNAVSLIWTAPKAGTMAIGGYCITRETVTPGYGASQYIALANPAATSYTDTGSAMSGGLNSFVNPFQESWRFTAGSDGFKTIFTQSNTADRTIIWPDAGGTVCFTTTCTGATITVNGGSALPSPVNFQNGPTFQGLTINAVNPSGSNVDFTLAGTATEALLPATSVFTDQSAVFGAHTYNFSSASLAIPTGAGYTTTAAANIGIDTTSTNPVFFLGGSNTFIPVVNTPGGWINGDCAQIFVAGTQLGIVDAGGICTTGTTAAFNTLTSGITSHTGTFGGSGNVWDFNAATSFKIPVGAGLAPTASGLIGYNSTSNLWAFGQNGSTLTLAQTISAVATQFLSGYNAVTGAFSQRVLVSADVPNNAANTTGNAATATALAGTPSLCSTGQAPTGILPSGNATGCAPIGGGGGTPGGSNTQVQYNASGSFGGAANWLYTVATGAVTLNQLANSNETLYGTRKTDTSPTGNFVHFQNAAANADIFKLDVLGNLTTALILHGSALTTGASVPVAAGSTANGGFDFIEATSTGWNPTAGEDYCRADSALHALKCSWNGAAEVVIPQLAGDFGGTSASPTVTNLSHVTNASLASSGLANTAVTPGSCGDATHSCSITANAEGQITALTNNTISGGGGGSSNACTNNPAPGAYTPTNTTGNVDCLSVGTYTRSAAFTVSANNVTILCTSPGAIIQFTGATAGFTLSGNYDKIQGCGLDHNSNTTSGTGPLVTISGNSDEVSHVTFTNVGVSNPQTAGCVLVVAGNQALISGNTATSSDYCLAVIPNASTTVKDTIISGNQITTGGTNTLGGIFGSDSINSGAVVTGLQILNNTCYDGTNATNGNCYYASNNIAQTSASKGWIVSGNKCYATTEFGNCYKLFGFFSSTFTGNYADDLTQTLIGALFNFGDTYDTAITGNSGKATSVFGLACMQLIDFGRDTVSGNICDGGVGTAEFFITTAGNIGSDTVFSGNVAHFTASTAGIGFDLVCNYSSQPCDNNTFIGNTVYGDNTASQVGFNVTNTAGGIHSTEIGGFNIYNVPTGITIGSGVNDTVVNAGVMRTVTTLVTDSGTNSQINTHTYKYSGALTTGTPSTLAVTLSGINIFSSSSSYACTANDNTATTTALLKVTYASGTSFTVTGGNANTDTVSGICTGY